MLPTRPIDKAQMQRWRKTVFWVSGCVALITLATAVGCSAEKKYRVLSFFFDGVPNPNAPRNAANGQQSESGPAGTVVRTFGITHKPFADGKCTSCHAGAIGSFENFQKVPPSICITCHKTVTTQYPVMHGPVVSVECLLCHVPHESSVPGMLNAAPPAVCVQCHDRDLLSASPPEHLLADSACLKCHVAHGGAKHGFLRPATQPSAAPARGAAS